ncbi:hypothetical protein BC829DRAFT_249366 [Chytridium lagenaria]|nr:hypothetical protein BC829DRAFT_249366 [Chytridium lagenaria]
MCAAGADAGNAASAPQPVAQAPPQAKRDGRPAPGKRMRVVKRYVPKLDDEVYLEVGDTVEIEDVFEDGWGCGVNITSSESGAFPLSTLDSNNRSAKQRVQSMYFGGRGGPNEAPEDDLR